MTWPHMTAEKCLAFETELAEAINTLSSVADRITHYPGHGGSSHRLRTAASEARIVADDLQAQRDYELAQTGPVPCSARCDEPGYACCYRDGHEGPHRFVRVER